jgi:tRNA (cmo5U34)-methyltransferase
MSVEQAFNNSAEHYDAWVHKALPGFDELFATALRAISFPTNQPIRVLDLGAGLFSSFVQQKYPQARFILVDLAEQMLRIASERFQACGERFIYTLADIRTIEYENEFDLVISSLAIHHLEHSDKQQLFARVQRTLNTPGLFLNIDQIHAPTPALRELYWAAWLEHVRSAGASEEQIIQSIRRRQDFDHDALLTDQLAWLRAAGFGTVDVLYKNWFVGVFFASKDTSQGKN